MARTRTKQAHSAPRRAPRACTKISSYREPSTDEEREDDGARTTRRSNPPRTLRSTNHPQKRKRGYASDSEESDEEIQSPHKKRRNPPRPLRSTNHTQKRKREYAGDSEESDEEIQSTHKKRRVVAEENDDSTLESRPIRSLRSSNRTRGPAQQLVVSSDAQDSDDEIIINRKKQVTEEDAQDSDDELIINTHRRKKVIEDLQDSDDEIIFNTHRKKVTQPERESRRELRSANGSAKRNHSAYTEAEDSQSSDDDYQGRTRKKRRVISKVRSTPPTTDLAVQSTQASGIIPDWASLPFHILCQIFKHASSPIVDDLYQSTPSTQWLLNTSLVCKKFTEPCMQALYRSPPLAPMVHAHMLVQHLEADQNAMSMKYRIKIKSLQFEVSSTAAYTLPGNGVLDLYGLVRNSTGLKDLEIYHKKDFASYKALGNSIKWRYPDRLFEALDETWTEEVNELDSKTDETVTTLREHGPIKLRSWRWNSRLAGEKQELPKLQALHLTPKFHNLEKIAFVNYRHPELSKDKHDTVDEHVKKVMALISEEVKILASAIGALPKLQHLILESCTIVTAELLQALPHTIKILEIINCPDLTAEDLTTYLESNSRHLRELILNRNEELSLSFLPALSDACRLEVLRVNLHHEPYYENLLWKDEVPTWPSTLRVIDLNHLCKWDTDVSEMFFKSIVKNAANFPDLRELRIKASLGEASWKVRAGVRQKWEETMQKVFLANRPPPNPTWTSIQAMKSQFRGSVESESEQIGGIHGDIEDELSIGELPESHVLPPAGSVKATRKRKYEEPPVPSMDRAKRTTRSIVTYAEPESSDEAEDELVGPSTPEYYNDSYGGELASPPSTAGRARAGSDDEEPIRQPYIRKMYREIAALHATAGQNRLPSESRALLPSSPPNSGADTEDEDLRKSRSQSKSIHDELFVQGMCDTVDVTISNLRPREKQYTETDFLGDDDNDSSDGDWNGRDPFDPGEEDLAF